MQWLQANATGDLAHLAYDTPPGGPVASWTAAAPNNFTVSTANETTTDLATSADGSIFVMRAANTTEVRGPDLALFSTPAAAELGTIPNRVAVLGIAVHPTGALLYEPFLDGPAPAAPPATGIHGGIDIRDAHNGQLRLRVYLPEPFAMLNTDVDGPHGGFLATDEKRPAIVRCHHQRPQYRAARQRTSGHRHTVAFIRVRRGRNGRDSPRQWAPDRHESHVGRNSRCRHRNRYEHLDPHYPGACFWSLTTRAHQSGW